jgi:hypothetical protein
MTNERRSVLKIIGAGALCLVALSGCISNPNAVTAQNAPADVAHSTQGYVAFEAYRTNNGLLGDARLLDNVMFVNETEPFNPFYLRTAQSRKVQAFPLRPPGAIHALDPGTYRLVFLSIPNTMCVFGMSDAPLEFTVHAGEVVYLGALQYDAEKIGGFFDPNHFRVSFTVTDELAANRADIDKNLSLLPGAPTIQTRLMTIRSAEVEVSPHPHFGPAPPPAEEAPPVPPPPAAPPPSTGPWHETPSP